MDEVPLDLFENTTLESFSCESRRDPFELVNEHEHQLIETTGHNLVGATLFSNNIRWWPVPGRHITF